MSRINYRTLITQFLVFVLLQIPLLYKFVLFDRAFGFFYIGFLLFLPFGLNPFTRIFSGFAIGLFIDVFSNTPGLHAASCTVVMYLRDSWFLLVHGDPEDNPNISIFSLGTLGSIYYLLPLVFLHLLLVFSIEHGKWEYYLSIFMTTLWSSLFTFICVVIFNFVFAGKPSRS